MVGGSQIPTHGLSRLIDTDTRPAHRDRHTSCSQRPTHVLLTETDTRAAHRQTHVRLIETDTRPAHRDRHTSCPGSQKPTHVLLIHRDRQTHVRPGCAARCPTSPGIIDAMTFSREMSWRWVMRHESIRGQFPGSRLLHVPDRPCWLYQQLSGANRCHTRVARRTERKLFVSRPRPELARHSRAESMLAAQLPLGA